MHLSHLMPMFHAEHPASRKWKAVVLDEDRTSAVLLLTLCINSFVGASLDGAGAIGKQALVRDFRVNLLTPSKSKPWLANTPSIFAMLTVNNQ